MFLVFGIKCSHFVMYFSCLTSWGQIVSMVAEPYSSTTDYEGKWCVLQFLCHPRMLHQPLCRMHKKVIFSSFSTTNMVGIATYYKNEHQQTQSQHCCILAYSLIRVLPKDCKLLVQSTGSGSSV